MKFTTWADGLIRVQRSQEDGYQARLSELNAEIATREQHLDELQQQWRTQHHQLQQWMAAATCGYTLAQSAGHCRSIGASIDWHRLGLEKLYQQRRQLQQKIKDTARQRILLEGIREKQLQRQLQEVRRQEELLQSELARYRSRN